MKKLVITVMCALVSAVALANVGATQEWVKQYVRGYRAPTYVAPENQKPVVSETIIDEDGCELSIAIVPNLIPALLVTNSKVAEVPNGTVFIFDESINSYKNASITDCPLFYNGEKSYVTEGEDGYDIIETYPFFTCVSPSSWTSAIEGGRVYMRRNSSPLEQFELVETRISTETFNHIKGL